MDYWDPKVVRSAAGAHFRLPVYYGLDWDSIPQLIPEYSSIFIADSNAKVNDETELSQTEEPYDIPVLPYYGIEYSTLKNITLIVGGETEGISDDSYR